MNKRARGMPEGGSPERKMIKMHYIASCWTDIGRKKTNQDAILIQLAGTPMGMAALLVLCDGMGGYAKGENASAALLSRFETWFEQEFPQLLRQGFSPEALRGQWEALVQYEHRKIARYGERLGVRVGTTLTAALFYGQSYYIIHVGDCRLYEILPMGIRQLTVDQSVVQREIEHGRLTPEAARRDKRRNLLLQAVGAGSGVVPRHLQGQVQAGARYLVCSDGFRHELTDPELYRAFAPRPQQEGSVTRESLCAQLQAAVTLNKQRGEADNITAGLLAVMP